ncbi:hypothetical protein A9Q91_03615 [Candidatus Gracilibacteria bacterium 28_42_T64]|nr:hypothetical protein A9Q91_03615 [Candidatus Gracilibacteria bacterium 28_42_T64]
MNEEIIEIDSLGSSNNEIIDMMSNPEMIEIMSRLGTVWLILNILFLSAFLLKAWGLYNINKNLGEPYPWLAWIPVFQIYSFVKAAGKDAIWILWLILGFIALIIPGIVITVILCHEISKRTGRGAWSTLGIFFIPAIMLPIIGYKLEEKKNIENNTKKEIKKEEEL